MSVWLFPLFVAKYRIFGDTDAWSPVEDTLDRALFLRHFQVLLYQFLMAVECELRQFL